jgi:predicted CXXCH cytochrome family protein
MKLPDRRYLAFGIGLAATAGLPLLAGFTSLGWESAEIAGFAATLACLALCGCPVRPRQSMPPALLSLRRHETLGCIALGFAMLHVALALITDHTVLEYLKPTTPLYQLAGIMALLLLAVLVLSSLERWRRRLWRSHRDFQAQHILFGCLLLILLAAHVVTADRYTGGYLRRVVFILAAAGITLLLRRRRMTGTTPLESTATRGLVFGRHSSLVTGFIVAMLLLLTPLVVGRADIALREPLLRRAQALPLEFDHGKHVVVNCLVCHHNYADGKGFDSCIQCHRSTRADLKVGVEARFHSFCLNCHRNPEPRFLHHGPVSGCASCHAADSHTMGMTDAGAAAAPLSLKQAFSTPVQ